MDNFQPTSKLTNDHKTSPNSHRINDKTFDDNFQRIFDQEIDPAFAQRSAYIIRSLQKTKAKNILDAGCGRSYYVKLISMLPSTEKVIGIDINKEYLKRAKTTLWSTPNAEIQQASIYKLPYKNNSFDAVVCSEILEHLDDDEAALKEIKRVLKPGGVFLASVPNENFPFLWDPLNWILMKFFHTHINKNVWWLAGIWADHVRLYSKKKLLEKIRNAGFKVKDNEEFIRWCWPFSHFFLYAIGKNLVERFGASGFDRFNINKPKPLSSALATFMRLPSKLLDKRLPIRSSMNLVVLATK